MLSDIEHGNESEIAGRTLGVCVAVRYCRLTYIMSAMPVMVNWRK
ncbi:hypothetical protein Plhal304r1_c004g0016111 [Plasmopara halstedii]